MLFSVVACVMLSCHGVAGVMMPMKDSALHLWNDIWDPPERCSTTHDNETECTATHIPEKLPENLMFSLRRKIEESVRSFGFNSDSLQRSFHVLKGLKVLDVGMGQGPLCAMAMMEGVRSYTGLDPALCINKNACTRDKTIARTPSENSCRRIGASLGCNNECNEYRNCLDELVGKYKLFPFTGVQMMQAYPGKVTLLPGTFESLEGTGFLKAGAFDAVTLRSVTEHLPDNFGVLKNIFDVLKPKQRVCILHHNYYGYDGHHSVPKSPRQYHENEDKAEYTELAQWGHLNVNSSEYNKDSLNRVRLGDLLGLVDMHFDCSWRATSIQGVPHELEATLKKNPLLERGFTKTELIVNHLYMSCVRRPRAKPSDWMKNAIWHHPPTDNSYVAKSLPLKLRDQVERKTTRNDDNNVAHHNIMNAPMGACF